MNHTCCCEIEWFEVSLAVIVTGNTFRNITSVYYIPASQGASNGFYFSLGCVTREHKV